MAGQTLSGSFSETSNDTAIIVPGKKPFTVSFKQLTKDILEFQSELAKLGIGRDDAVSIALPNTYEFIVSFLATTYQRAVLAPLNPGYKKNEFEFYINDLSSALLLVPKGACERDEPSIWAGRNYGAAIAECYLEGTKVVLDLKEKGKLGQRKAQRVSQALPEDVALVLHTSGTTGKPKAVPLTHRNLTRTMRNIQQTYELSPKDRTMLVMPLFHVHGLLAGLLSPLMSGGSVVVPPKFSASTFWDDFTQHGANWYTAVPTIHQILLKNPAPEPIPNIRFIRSCSSSLSPNTMAALEQTYKTPVLEAYAMTEAAHQMCSNQLPHRGKRKAGSVGIGQGVEVRILDLSGMEVPQGSEGEICVCGENVTKGYINNTKANAEAFTTDKFFRTGDQGKKDEDGYVIITGRIKELIVRGGEKISPIELDNVITSIPEVGEAVSFGIPDEMLGQQVGVAVVPKAGKQVLEQNVIAFVKAKLAAHKTPKRVSLAVLGHDCVLTTCRFGF